MSKETLRAGDPACYCDTWFRYLTNKRHLRSDGKPHHAAFRGKALAGNGNHAELSGRLASLAGSAGDIKQDGEARARDAREVNQQRGSSGKDFVFVGVIYAVVADIRSSAVVEADVIYDPTPQDAAHANIVFSGLNMDGGPSAGFLDDLVEMFQVALPESLSCLSVGV